MVIQTDKIRVKIDEKEQREIFSKFAKKFKNKKNAAEFLNISKYNFHDYSHCRTRYVPLKIMNKIVQELKIKNLKIIDKKSLKQIRQGFIEKATIAFKKKYGDNWKKVLNENSKKGLYKKYGNYAYKKITQKGHKSSEAKYGKEWRKILSKKGIKSLKKKYGNNWYEIILSRGREKLRKKYGKQWQKELSKLAMESLRKKYVKNFERKHSNIKKIFQNRKPTKSEKLIAGFLKKNNIPFETNVIKENLEFDIVIPNKNNPECVIEVSSAKPTTYNQRMKILKLHYQKVIFPNAQHIAILRSKYSKKGKKYSLHKIIKSFLDKENITLLSLENINKYIKQLIECIKKNKKVDIKEKFSFNKKAIANSRKGCITQAKKINDDELKLNNILTKIGAIPNGPHILEIKDNFFICTDNFEIYKNKKIAYEINSSNSHNSLRSLAGKILLYKRFNKDVKFIVILMNPTIFNNSSFQFLEELSDCVVLRKNFNKNYIRNMRNHMIS